MRLAARQARLRPDIVLMLMDLADAESDQCLAAARASCADGLRGVPGLVGGLNQNKPVLGRSVACNSGHGFDLDATDPHPEHLPARRGQIQKPASMSMIEGMGSDGVRPLGGSEVALPRPVALFGSFRYGQYYEDLLAGAVAAATSAGSSVIAVQTRAGGCIAPTWQADALERYAAYRECMGRSG
jgi:hypothetical protein